MQISGPPLFCYEGISASSVALTFLCVMALVMIFECV